MMWNQWVFKGIKLCESKPFMTDIYGERQPRLVALVGVVHSNCRTTISGFDPRRSGGPQVPAPLEVNTCILPMRLSP